MSDLILYNYFRSSTSYRARIALNIKGLDFEYKQIHLLNNGGEQNTPEYRKLNPMGGVPSLIHSGKLVAQSRAIIEYLNDSFPEPPLFPKNLHQTAIVKQICDTINCDIHPLQNLRVMRYLENKLGLNEEQRLEWINEWVGKGFTALETLVKKSAEEYCFGSKVTTADLFLIPAMFSADRFKIDLEQFPTLYRIFKTCNQLPAFKKSHPYRQVDTPDDLRIK